jgi:hypothetical protein
MTQQITRQIALITVFTTCMLIVAMIVTFGLGANPDTAMSQVLPLALVCSIALAILLTDPFTSRT